jgi:glycosyltransferase involved in cell wall biosynthesis
MFLDLCLQPKVLVLSDGLQARHDDAISEGCNDTSAQLRQSGLYAAATLVLTMTDDDRKQLARLHPGMSSRTLPFKSSVMPTVARLHGGWSDRSQSVLFLGAAHPASRRALRWLIRNVWPHVIAHVPSAILRVAGPLPDKAVETKGKGVELLGAVGGEAALQRAMADARALAVPMLSSTRVPARVFDALAHAVPIVTTAKGARDLLPDRTSGAVAVAKTSADFAATLVRLLLNATTWRQQRVAALRHTMAHLSPERFRRRLRRVLWDVMEVHDGG